MVRSKTSAEYWSDRITAEQIKLYDKGVEQINKEIAKQYKIAITGIEKDVATLFNKLLEQALTNADEILIGDLYKFNRFIDLQKVINNQLRELGEAEIDIYNDNFIKMYQNNEKILEKHIPSEYIQGSFIIASKKEVQSAVNSVWCSDGSIWSDRIWSNKAQLQNRIEKGLIDSVARGKSKDILVDTLINIFDVAFYEADRIARTELTYILNKSSADKYKALGVERYEYLAELDSRTSKPCKSINGNTYYFTEQKVGVNFPPMHPNCRCTIIPIVD